jgi:hypothetical protein
LTRYLRGRINQTKANRGISAQTATFMLAAVRRFVRWLANKHVGVPADLFDSIPGFDPTNERVHARRDVNYEELGRILEAAGVPFCVEVPNGKAYADFHALRHSFCSALAAAGTNPKVLQSLARHSDIRLTLDTYTHMDRSEESKAINRMRMPGQGPISPLAGLTRDELEGAVFGLTAIIRTLLQTWRPGKGGIGTVKRNVQIDVPESSGSAQFRQSGPEVVLVLGVPLGVPQMDIIGDSEIHLDTIPLKRKGASV